MLGDRYKCPECGEIFLEQEIHFEPREAWSDEDFGNTIVGQDAYCPHCSFDLEDVEPEPRGYGGE